MPSEKRLKCVNDDHFSLRWRDRRRDHGSVQPAPCILRLGPSETPALTRVLPMPATAALLVIDVQQGLCQGEYAAHDAAGLIQRINTLSEKARAAGAPVVFIQHEAASGPLQHGSSGWPLAEGLNVAENDLRLRKTTPDAFLRTMLEALLLQHGIARVVICGLQSEFCVDTTTRRAMALGFSVTLVADGHSTLDSAELTAPQITAHHNRLLPQISSFGSRTQCLQAEEVCFD